jgi:nitroreductase
MDFTDLIRKRRMVRHFTDEPVPVETARRLIALAQRAQSAGHAQRISFVLVTEEATLRRIALLAHEEAYPRSFISEAPIQIVICADETR